MEYAYLAKLTGKVEYFNRVGINELFQGAPTDSALQSEGIMKTLSSANLTYTSGMLPVKWNITSGEIFNCPFQSRVSQNSILTLSILCRSSISGSSGG